MSARIGWSIESQKFNICLNQMATIFLALNGVKIIPNFRIGELETLSSLSAYPKNISFVVGALGCWKGNSTDSELMYLKLKLLVSFPAFFYVYGKIEDWYLEMLDEARISYQCFSDFRALCYKKENKNERF